MPLVRFDNVSLAFGHVPLLDQVNFQLDSNERVCLIGRNGVGKSSFLQLLMGGIQPDDGSVWIQPELRLASLSQELSLVDGQSVYQVVAAGLGHIGATIAAYHDAALELSRAHSAAHLNTLEVLQQKIEAENGWSLEHRVESIISRFGLDSEAAFNTLSGGVRRKVLLARALVLEPDLLLLDEPTNHLDIQSIEAIEEILLSFPGAVLFITHDRYLMQRTATRMIELDRGILTSWSEGYQSYLRRKAELLEVEDKANAEFDKRLAQEEAWIRQGIKARRTRNQGRVSRLLQLREERQARRVSTGNIKLNVNSETKSGKLVAELENVHFHYHGNDIIKDFSIRIQRGDRIGFVGPNGVGKSTLIQLILGALQPSRGNIRLGTKLEIAYFDQQRAQLDENKSVVDNIHATTDQIVVNGKPKHVISYLNDFLFPVERIHSPVKSLSGGERNRLLLAKLFTQPANILVLDEPTNDLDIESLELLEELLTDFSGTLLLVSHDRAFVENVVTSILAFEGNGILHEYIGGYSDYLRQRETRASTMLSQKKTQGKNHVATQAKQKRLQTTKKLSYIETRELELLPDQIEALEQKRNELQQRTLAPEFYKQDKSLIADVVSEIQSLEEALAQAYARWDQLEQTH